MLCVADRIEPLRRLRIAPPTMPRLPALKLPPGVTFQQWCRDVLEWGVGAEGARQRMQTVTRDELIRKALTVEVLEAIATWLAAVLAETPSNPAAGPRQELVKHMIRLLRS